MIRKIASTALFAAAIALVCAVVNAQEFPIMDKIADKVIQKYQTSTCEQLWQERAQKGKAPPPQMEQEALQMLKSDSQMRAAFINKIAAPIANKMFECGMIP
jgi:LPS O-antigen subunit length determinant protein (WzzB/FepE family)